jgi:hypothetical protein
MIVSGGPVARGWASVGVAENANTAVLVTLSSRGVFLDRRTIVLTHDLPTHPYHHEGAWAVGRYLNTPGARKLPLSEAIELVKRVTRAAEAGARKHLESLAADISEPIKRISLRVIPPMPATIEARIKDNRAQTTADSAMYRQALATAAKELGWSVQWYDKDELLEREQPLVSAIGKKAGAPWQAKHKLAAAAALSDGPRMTKPR